MSEECVTCGHAIDTPFCPSCGEKRAADRTYSVWEFVKDHVVEEVVAFDGRVIRTFKTLLAAPGELTRAFMRGVRIPYLAPLQLFLLLNLAFFLWSAATKIRIFDSPLEIHVSGTLYQETARRMVSARLERTHEDAKTYTARFDTVGTAQARSLVVTMVPAFALLVGVLTLRRRRPQATPVQHLVFSLHFFAFLFLLLMAAAYLIDAPLTFVLERLGAPPGPYHYDSERTLAGIVVQSIYLAIALRRAYELGWIRATATAIALGFAFWFALIQWYRELLFFVTFYSM